MKKTLKQIKEMLQIETRSPFDETVVTGICFDTRVIEAGDLFVPFVGAARDGHEFVDQARKAGASAAFWQKDVPNPPADFPLIFVDDTLLALQQTAAVYLQEVNPKVIAVTGSNGKTTTKDILSGMLRETFRVHRTGGNFNNHIGLPYTILTMPEDTEVAVLEMGMNHRHEIEVLSQIAQPDIAIITNIGEAHIEYLGSREEIANAKFEIVTGLKADGLFIYPGDEPLLTEHTALPARSVTFGRTDQATIFATTIKTSEEGTTFTTNQTADREFYVPIIGEHNVFNSMAAMLAAFELGVEPETIQTALRHIDRSKSRLEWLTTPKGSRILNDAYNSSPTALKTVLNTFLNMPTAAKKYLVLADMLELGDFSDQLHQESARTLENGEVAGVFLYGTAMKNFADEAASLIGQEKVHYFTDKEALTDAVSNALTGNEWILVKGSYSMGLKDVVEKLMIG